MPAESFRLTVDTQPLEDSLRVGPSTSYYWLRTWLFGALLEHRVQWLKSKKTSFGRGKDAIKVWRINAAPKGDVDPKWVVYRVSPDAKKQATRQAAEKGLKALRAEAHAGSIALEVHQTGDDINVGSKWLAVPLRKGPRSPTAWRRRFPGKKLLTIRDPKRADRLYLVERKRYRGRRQDGREARNSNKKVVRDKLIRRFVLLHKLKMQPTLRFYEQWDALESARQKDFARIADRILKDIARGRL